MARAPKYTIKRNWGWMTNIVVRKKSRTSAPKPDFAILRGLGRPSLLAASALGTVLLVTPAVVNKAHAVDLNVSGDLPYSANLPSGTTVNVNNGIDCVVSNDTCIDINVYNAGGELNVVFSGLEHDFDVNDSGDAIVLEAWDDDIDITITNSNTASDIYVENGSGIVVYADNNDSLGDVEVTWLGDITASNYGVYVENVGNPYEGNVGSVTINVGNIDTGDDGVHVGNVWGGPVDINVAGSINTAGDFADGVEVHDVAGDVFVEVIGSTNTDGLNADGVYINGVYSTGGATDGNVTVEMGDITTNGEDSDGVDVSYVDGFVDITTGDITTGNLNSAFDSNGVRVRYVGGDVDVLTGDISTNGEESDGIDIGNVAGPVTVTTGDITTGAADALHEDANGVNIFNVDQGVTVSTGNITTFGSNSDGIDIDGIDGDVSATVTGDIATTGEDADGVDIDGVDGSVNVTVTGDVSTNGNGANGIDIDGDISVFYGPNIGFVNVTITDSVTVDVGDVTTNGYGADGMDIEDILGPVTITMGDVSVNGEDSDGFEIDDIGGSVSIIGGNVAALGDGSRAINISDVEGTVYVNVGDISTDGMEYDGTYADAVDIDFVGDDVTIITRNITTNGESSDGVDIDNIDGTVRVTTGDITTGSFADAANTTNSDAVDIGGNISGGVVVNTGNITTWGNASDGVTVRDVEGVVDVTSRDISTNGNSAEGVNIRYTRDDVIVNVGELSTDGEFSEAVTIGNIGGSVRVTTKGITTDGEEARGVEVFDISEGNVNITVNGDISTRGDYADGIAVIDVWDGGVDITVNGNITTSGFNADGGFIDPIFGDVNVTINGGINASGTDSDGWYVQGVYANGGDAGDVSITVNGDITTNGELGDGIEILDVEGSVTVDVDDIQTGTGLNPNDDAHGVIIGNVGGGVTVTTGNIATFGEFSEGIVIYDVSEGVIDVNVNGGITTNGEDADGVEVTEFYGDQVDITVTGNIETNDDNSHGVFVHEVYADNGNVGILVNVNNVTTSGEDSDGVNISGNIGADMTVNVTGDILVTGDDSAGIKIGFDDETDGNVYVSGDVVVNVSEGASIYSEAEGEFYNNGAIVVATRGDIEINNSGNLGASNGFTMSLFSGPDSEDFDGKDGDYDITVNNDEGGVIIGDMIAVSYGGSVVVNNDGLFDAETLGDKDGGPDVDFLGLSVLAGGDVEFNNSGTFRLTGEDGEVFVLLAVDTDNASMAETSGPFDKDNDLGFDPEFNNTDLVTLVDGDPTDTLVLLGKNEDFGPSDGKDGEFDWDGGPGSVLALDAYLAGPDDSEADELYIDGDTTGQTVIVINDVDPTSPGAYNPEGIEVVTVTGDTELGDFVLAGGPIDKGLFVYDLYLREDGYFSEWVLANIPGQAAQEAPSLITGLEELGHQAMAVGVDRLGVLGDCAVSYRPGINPTADAPGCDDVGGSVWMSVLGRSMSVDGDASFGLFGQSTDFDVSYDQVMWGLIAGADGGKTWTNSHGSLSSVYGGVLGGYLSTTMDFDSGNEGSYDGGMAGIYGGYQSGAWFLNGVLTGMFGTLSFDSNSLDPWGGADDSDVFQVGGTVDTGYRFGAERGMAGVYFEPGVTLSVLSTSIDDAEWAGNEMSFEDSTSFRGRVGAKVGMETEGGFNAYVEASLWNEFGDDPEISIGSLNAPDVSVTGDGLGMWADIGLGIGFVSEHWAIGAKGDVAFGEDMMGYGGSVKLQVSW